jgi:phospholipid/cholesterol/gamma-HCH transport system ATP-binding protein
MSDSARDKSTPEPVIRVRGLQNRFGDHDVHKNLDLDVLPGEILGVVGGSGTGKSVLMRSILGLQTPTAGTIECSASRSIISMERRRKTCAAVGVCCSRTARYSRR